MTGRAGEASAGFALPMALLGGLGLLLGSLSLQSVGLAARQQTLVELRLQQAEDGLASAAHRLVGAVGRGHGCLLLLPLEQWESAGQACADAGALAALRQPEPGVRLLAWQPSPAGATEPLQPEPPQVELLLEAVQAGVSRRGSFVFRLAERPWRPLDLRSRGLVGAEP